MGEHEDKIDISSRGNGLKRGREKIMKSEELGAVALGSRVTLVEAEVDPGPQDTLASKQRQSTAHNAETTEKGAQDNEEQRPQLPYPERA